MISRRHNVSCIHTLWASGLVACFLLSLAACAPTQVRSPLARWAASPNHDSRAATLIVLHATEQDSVQQSLHTLRTRNVGGRVSAHYLIGRDGEIHQLVSEDRRAWHAGAGSWGTLTNINSSSIGIELDNNGTDPFPAEQIQSLIRLLADICKRQRIRPSHIIAHADLAPARKVDPGPLFPWQQLAAAGFGAWPSSAASPPAEFDAMTALRLFGYPMADPDAAIRAFHIRFRGRADLPAQLDAQDAAILYALHNANPPAW